MLPCRAHSIALLLSLPRGPISYGGIYFERRATKDLWVPRYLRLACLSYFIAVTYTML